MDDWVILAPTRWKLRRAIRAVNSTLEELQVEQHPDKTYIGPVERGFDFLGYSFTPEGLGVAPRTVQKFATNIARLYEQGATSSRLGQYADHWSRWSRAGIHASTNKTKEPPKTGSSGI